MAWQSHLGATTLPAPPEPCPLPHSLSDLVEHGGREGVTCPTVTWGFLSPPHLPKPKEVLGIALLGCSYPPQSCSAGVREHRDPEQGQELTCCYHGLSMIPPKTFVPPLCSREQTQPMVGRDPASSPTIPGATFHLGASMGARRRGPRDPGTQPPQSEGDGRQTLGSTASPPGTSLLEGIRLTSIRDGWVLPQGGRGN